MRTVRSCISLSFDLKSKTNYICTAKAYAICITHYLFMVQFSDYFKILWAISICANSNGHLAELENVYILFCNII